MNKVNIKRTKFIIAILSAGLLIAFALIAPVFAPYDPLQTNFSHILEKPGPEFIFGTDQVGRCIFSRILYGLRVSLGMTFVLLCSVFVLGVIIGIFAGMHGGFVDALVMRLADTILAFPDIVFAIAIVGILGPGIRNTIMALSVIWWTKYARLTRILVMTVREKEYIHAARMAGASRMRVVTHYVLPNILSPLFVQMALDVGSMMLALSGLSFLGLGVQAPTPELGTMLSEGRSYMQTASWLLIYPGLAIFVIVSVFNILGDSVRDLLDPKQQ